MGGTGHPGETGGPRLGGGWGQGAWSHGEGRDGVMVQAGRMVEPCRVRKGDGMLLHMGTWSHSAGKADGVSLSADS